MAKKAAKRGAKKGAKRVVKKVAKHGPTKGGTPKPDDDSSKTNSTGPRVRGRK